MASRQQIYSLLDFVIERLHGYEVSVTAQSNSEGLTRFANSEINQNVYEDKTTLYVRVSDGKRRIEVVTSAIERPDLEHILQSAVAKLKAMPEQGQEVRLVESPQEIVLDHFNEEISERFGIEQRARLIKACLDEIPNKAFHGSGAMSHVEYQLAVSNSRGIRRFHRSNMVTFTALVSKPGSGSGSTRITSTSPDGFDCLAAMRRAYEKAAMNQNQVDLDLGKYTVILEPAALNDLLAFVAAIGFSGRSVQDGTSFLAGKFGQQIFSDKISITDDWTHSATIHVPFDFEGSMRQTVTIINRGIASGVAHDLESASKAGTQSTGHAYPAASWGMIPLNLIMVNGEKPISQMIAETDNGLLVTRLHYVNPVDRRKGVLTALTKDGLFRIQGGKLSGAAKNMRFTTSVFDIFNNVLDVSAERERTKWWYPMTSYYLPGIKIANFPFTGKTDA